MLTRYKFDLEQISPKAGLRYSPNLYRWMKKNGHFGRDGSGTPYSLWRVTAGQERSPFYEGSLMIGMAGDQGDFLGSRLMNVLCEGSKASTWCYPGLLQRLEPVEGFWDRYLKVGRCAVDPDHSVRYLDDRWAQSSTERRTCLWCGMVQNRRVFTELVNREEWV